MEEHEHRAVALMHAALCEFLSYDGAATMPVDSLLEVAAQAALVAESAFPQLKD